jgi:hypothetical protein
MACAIMEQFARGNGQRLLPSIDLIALARID